MRLNPKIFEILKNGKKEERKYICEREPIYFAIYYFSEYFTYPIPDFHIDFYSDMKGLVNGDLDEAAWIAFRESAKSSLAKIFATWCICYSNKNYINYDSYDKSNAESALFDIAVSLQTNKKIISDFGQLFTKQSNENKESKIKRISNFITENEIKVEAFSTQEPTRGRIYKNNRPDLFILDDIENNKTKESYPVTKKIVSHIDELKAGMSTIGSVLYLGNLITDDGVVDYVLRAVQRNKKGIARNIPVIANGATTWKGKYVMTDIEAVEANKEIEDREKHKVSLEDKRRKLGDKVFETEMMNNPAKAGDLFFERDIITNLLKEVKEPIKDIAGLKIWGEYKADHVYGGGADTSEGKGLDANSLVIIDYSSTPKRVVATYESNTITPNLFAHECKRAGNMYGECVFAPEINNTGFATLAELQNIYDNIYVREVKNKITGKMANEYGFRSTIGNKYDILGQLKSAVESGDLLIQDEGLLKEIYHYKKQDLNALKMEDGMTRHFDKLVACAIAWEIRKHAGYSKQQKQNIFTNNFQDTNDY